LSPTRTACTFPAFTPANLPQNPLQRADAALPSRDDGHTDAARGGVRRYALRLNGQLLLGYTRIHSFKVKFFQEDIKASPMSANCSCAKFAHRSDEKWASESRGTRNLKILKPKP